jgi:hypothetical protein
MTQSGGTRRRTRRVLWRADPLDAGQAIVWARDGRELFYRVGDDVRAVAVELAPTFRPSPPRTLFSGRYARGGCAGRQFHIAPDGRFLMIRDNAGQTGNDSSSGHFVAVFNWFDELEARVPVN